MRKRTPSRKGTDLSAEVVAALPDWLSVVEARELDPWLVRLHTTKICSDCGERKLLTEFHKMASAASGHRPSCKECRKR